MTGTRAVTHGVLSNIDQEFDLPTLPGELRTSGYQTHMVGKMHLYPKRKRYGFDSMVWSDGPYEGDDIGDYGTFLQREAGNIRRPACAHGATLNSWIGRPWHLEDRLHFTNWVTDNAIDFLDRRDPTVPFFLKVSYFHPHQPVACPEFYYNRYIDMNLPEPFSGDWVDSPASPPAGTPVRSRKADLPPHFARQFRAGYYGCINHIDDQIGRILDCIDLDGDGKDTLVIFTSDHGEMLGDHMLIGKRFAYEPSARIPMIVKPPESMQLSHGQRRNEVVELMDIMPTILDIAGVEVPESVEGRSMLPLLEYEGTDQQPNWRSHIHGECAHISQQTPDKRDLMQFVTDGKMKFIWFPHRPEGRRSQQFFDLTNDPEELTDLIADPSYSDLISRWRRLLVEELVNRPEGFVEAGSLSSRIGSE